MGARGSPKDRHHQVCGAAISVRMGQGAWRSLLFPGRGWLLPYAGEFKAQPLPADLTNLQYVKNRPMSNKNTLN